MESNLYHFFGFLVMKDSTRYVSGILDIKAKQSISHSSSSLDFNFSNIVFVKKSSLVCTALFEDKTLKQVKSLSFLYDDENDCYVAKVLAEKTFEQKFEKNKLIERDFNDKEVVGFLTILIINKNFLDYNFINQRSILLEKNKFKKDFHLA